MTEVAEKYNVSFLWGGKNQRVRSYDRSFPKKKEREKTMIVYQIREANNESINKFVN